jgi:hypothetical protein
MNIVPNRDRPRYAILDGLEAGTHLVGHPVCRMGNGALDFVR